MCTPPGTLQMARFVCEKSARFVDSASVFAEIRTRAAASYPPSSITVRAAIRRVLNTSNVPGGLVDIVAPVSVWRNIKSASIRGPCFLHVHAPRLIGVGNSYQAREKGSPFSGLTKNWCGYCKICWKICGKIHSLIVARFTAKQVLMKRTLVLMFYLIDSCLRMSSPESR